MGILWGSDGVSMEELSMEETHAVEGRCRAVDHAEISNYLT